MTRFYPVMWAGLWINVITGVLLTLAAASRVLVDPVFYIKMILVVAGVANMRLLKRELLRDNDPGVADETIPTAMSTAVALSVKVTGKIRTMAVASIVLWAGAITFGRLMAYTFFRFWQ